MQNFPDGDWDRVWIGADIATMRLKPGARLSENELAARVGLAIQRHGRRGPAVGVIDDEMLGYPAGARRGAAGFLQRQ